MSWWVHELVSCWVREFLSWWVLGLVSSLIKPIGFVCCNDCYWCTIFLFAECHCFVLGYKKTRRSLHWLFVLNNGFDNPNPNLRLCCLTPVHIK